MNYLWYQQLLTSSVNLVLIALFSLLLMQWAIGLGLRQPVGQRFAWLGQQPWWVKIRTSEPHCTYYFGPFPFRWMAERSQMGYCEDLQAEQAKGIEVTILQDQPEQLTYCEP
jgi:hypothetical protein